MPSQVFIVEDHPIVRRTLREHIQTISDLSVCGESASAEDALERISTIAVDLMLIDVSLNGMNGIDLVAQIVARWPHVRCLMVSGHQMATYANRALAAGARGYLVKGNPHEIMPAVQAVLAGEIYLSSAIR